MPTKSIYVRDADASLYSEAEGMSGMKFSDMITCAVREYVERRRDLPKDFGQIELTVPGENGPVRKRLLGRWLVTMEQPYIEEPESDEVVETKRWAALQTRKSIIFVCWWPGDNPKLVLRIPPMHYFLENLHAAFEEGVPEELVVMARDAAGLIPVEDWDV